MRSTMPSSSTGWSPAVPPPTRQPSGRQDRQKSREVRSGDDGPRPSCSVAPRRRRRPVRPAEARRCRTARRRRRWPPIPTPASEGRHRFGSYHRTARATRRRSVRLGPVRSSSPSRHRRRLRPGRAPVPAGSPSGADRRTDRRTPRPPPRPGPARR